MEDRKELAVTPEEAPAFVDRIESAATQLSRRYQLDINRVGLIGFSRAGYMTYYAITHPKSLAIAAAVEADGWTGSFDNYTLSAATENDPGHTEEADQQIGGSFWTNKELWLKEAPGFNVDRIRTPVLFTGNGPGAVATMYQLIGSLRMNNAPFEALFFNKGKHQLQRPIERRASMQATVDWMAFWLSDQAVTNGDDPTRAERWSALKQLVRK
jgi:dipeptidyl aminopeptidase/acylaminoacyl peptidase